MDMTINLLSTALSVALLNLVVYPILAPKIGAESYGQMQSIMSVVYVIGGTLGITLCSTRLILNFEYKEKQAEGDFNYILIVSLFIVSLILPLLLLLLFSKSLSYADYFLVLLIGLLNCIANYSVVGFRLIIDYKAILISKLFGCCGYLVGFLLFFVFYKWELIFIAALLAENLYYTVKTDIYKESYKRTFLFRKTVQSYINLGTASFLEKLLTYFDKLMIYPLLGGEAVTIYYVASIFGKIIIMIVEPIAHVILSYLAKEKTVSKTIWKKVLLLAFLSCSLMFILGNILSVPVIKILYPQWFDVAVKYVPICTFCLVVSAFIGLIYPLTLKTFEPYKQIIINGFSVIGYGVFIILLYKNYGIYGCCYALLVSQAIKLSTIMFFYLRDM